MIARRWRVWVDAAPQADAFTAHIDDDVRPRLRAIPGFVDASVERVPAADGGIEIFVVTRWESMEAVRRFAGDDPGKAVVDPEVRGVLAGWDTHVEHLEVPGGA